MLDENSIWWRTLGDVRSFLYLGRAFVLQAMHPTVAAGVAEHSNFQQDPWGRLARSFGMVLDTAYAPDDSVGAELRAAHKRIKGVTPEGRHYHAFEPEAYWWVLATGAESAMDATARFGPAISQPEQRRFYDETREVGRRMGLRDRDMQATLPEFEEWYRWMLAARIQATQTSLDVLDTFRRPSAPPGVPELLWPLPRNVLAPVIWTTTIGTLPPTARDKLGVQWSRPDAVQLARISHASRRLDLLPDHLRYLPQARAGFQRARREHATSEPAARGQVAA